ncbi:MAG: hypothetical protein EPN26_01685 [Rhodospirillales bacterium]|nr:MAG: hypothetical protein EPN26_01685 [Rhodospirillales bacterium]
MPYIIRNGQGNIIGVTVEPTEDTLEYLPGGHPEVVAFEAKEKDSGSSGIAATDFNMSRVTEDLIDLLISKKVINFSELPEQAQRKLLFRKSLRVSTLPEVGLSGDKETQ